MAESSAESRTVQPTNSTPQEKKGGFADFLRNVKEWFGGGKVVAPEDVGLSRSAAAPPEQLAHPPGIPPGVSV